MVGGREVRDGDVQLVVSADMESKEVTLEAPPKADASTLDLVPVKRSFGVDHVFWSHDGFVEVEGGRVEAGGGESRYASQCDVYDAVGRPALDRFMEGESRNGTGLMCMLSAFPFTSLCTYCSRMLLQVGDPVQSAFTARQGQARATVVWEQRPIQGCCLASLMI